MESIMTAPNTTAPPPPGPHGPQCTVSYLANSEPNNASLGIMLGSLLIFLGLKIRAARSKTPAPKGGVSQTIGTFMLIGYGLFVTSMLWTKMEPCVPLSKSMFLTVDMGIMALGLGSYLCMFALIVFGLVKYKCRGCGKRGIPETKFCCFCGVKEPLASEDTLVEEESLLDVKEEYVKEG